MKERLADASRRLGEAPAGFHVLNHEDVENFAALNTPQGRKAVEAAITQIVGVDLIIFDNIMSLISGDMKEEESWRQTIKWQHSLTRRKIGQVWVHHTGIDESRSYGTKTKEWGLDTVMFAERLTRPDIDVSFKLKFTKARERTPKNRADFANCNVVLANDSWTEMATGITEVAEADPRMVFDIIQVYADQKEFSQSDIAKWLGRARTSDKFLADLEYWKETGIIVGDPGPGERDGYRLGDLSHLSPPVAEQI